MDPVITAWRRQKRAELLAARAAVTPEVRVRAVARIAATLDQLWAARCCKTLGLYWPIKDEIGLLPWGRSLAKSQGVQLCLPVVVTPRAPLEYWRWVPGQSMRPGFWSIPVPETREVMLPDLVIAPLVGVDAASYRLGYGGGYFDRTLAVMRPRPFIVGVGYEFAQLETIFPQAHDIPMDAIVTDAPTTRIPNAA